MQKRSGMLTLANQITIFRILLILPFVICMLHVNDPEDGTFYRYTAVGIFAIQSISDALDGYLARMLKQVSRLGRFLDPLADKLLMTCASILLSVNATAIEGFRLPGSIVVCIIGKDVILTLGYTTTYFLTGRVKIRPVLAGKLSTFLQLSMVLSILIGPEVQKIFNLWVYVVQILWLLTALAAILATIIYIRHGMQYINEFEQNTNNQDQE